MTTTRFPNGVTNVAAQSLLANLPVPFMFGQYTEWGEDFDRYRAGDWTDTIVGTGTVALVNAENGALQLTTSATAGDSVFLDKVGECFKFTSGQKLWFSGRFQVSDATATELVFGLQITDTTPTAVSNGVYFHKAAGSAALDLVQVSAASGTTTTTSGILSLANATYYTVRFYYDGASTIYYQVLDATGVVVAGGAVVANVPAVTQTISFGLSNGATAAAESMTVDYIWTAQETIR